MAGQDSGSPQPRAGTPSGVMLACCFPASLQMWLLHLVQPGGQRRLHPPLVRGGSSRGGKAPTRAPFSPSCLLLVFTVHQIGWGFTCEELNWSTVMQGEHGPIPGALQHLLQALPRDANAPGFAGAQVPRRGRAAPLRDGQSARSAPALSPSHKQPELPFLLGIPFVQPLPINSGLHLWSY